MCDFILFATSWYLTLFATTLPFNVVVRIFDIFFFDGYKIIHKIALAIFKIKEKELLAANDFDDIIIILRDFNHPEINND